MECVQRHFHDHCWSVDAQETVWHVLDRQQKMSVLSSRSYRKAQTLPRVWMERRKEQHVRCAEILRHESEVIKRRREVATETFVVPEARQWMEKQQVLGAAVALRYLARFGREGGRIPWTPCDWWFHERSSGRDTACVGAVVQFDYDKRSRGMPFMARCWRNWEFRERSKERSYRTLTMALSGLIGPSTIDTNNMAIIDSLWRGKEGCIGPDQKSSFVATNLGIVDKMCGKELRFRCESM